MEVVMLRCMGFALMEVGMQRTDLGEAGRWQIDLIEEVVWHKGLQELIVVLCSVIQMVEISNQIRQFQETCPQ